jgi:hypothetical protein
MRKLAACVIIILSISSIAFAAGFSEPVVLRLSAYIPPRTTFTTEGDQLFVTTNAHNFSYHLVGDGRDRTVVVIAN